MIKYILFVGGLIGPAISAAILHVKDEGRAVYNSSYAATLWTKCGARDCPGNPLNETAIEPQNPDKVSPWSLAWRFITRFREILKPYVLMNFCRRLGSIATESPTKVRGLFSNQVRGLINTLVSFINTEMQLFISSGRILSWHRSHRSFYTKVDLCKTSW